MKKKVIWIFCLNEDKIMNMKELKQHAEERGLVPQARYDNGYSYYSSEKTSFEHLERSINRYRERYNSYEGERCLVDGFIFVGDVVRVMLIEKDTPKYSEVSFS